MIKIVNGDCREINFPNEIDLIFTDPPYAQEWHYLYEWLAKMAQKKLKEGRMLLCYTPPYWKLKIMKIFEDAGLYYFYDYILQHSGNTTILRPRKIISGYKSIMAFSKGRRPRLLTTTLGLYRGLKNDKRFHKWGQSESEARYFVSVFSEENEMVVDPFLGGGTAAVACKYLRRDFFGSEIEEEYVITTNRRLSGQHIVQKYEQIEIPVADPGA